MNSRSFEMGYTPKEFEKTLLGQFSSNTSYNITPKSTNKWSVGDITAKSTELLIDIEISVGMPRKIALLTLPVLNTTFTFQQTNEEQQTQFLNTFFKYFHKGGG